MSASEIAIVGGGPAGLMAAEMLATAGCAVTVYDAMPTVARKFLYAGKSGLNLTNAEPIERFVTRYGAALPRLEAALDAFSPDALRAWADGLGAECFTGSSGHVFPKAMKASPLLRAWLRRLSEHGVAFKTRHRWIGFDGDDLAFDTPDGRLVVHPAATLLALGGASYPRLGSDAAWVPWLEEKGVAIAPFRPANCGFDVAWSERMAAFAGTPVKTVAATSDAGTLRGECVVTTTGIEGSLIYHHAAALRDRLEADGAARLILDLLPGRSRDDLAAALARLHKASFTNRLRHVGIEGVKAALVRDFTSKEEAADPARLAYAIKALPLPLLRARPIEEAISSAGGVSWDGIGDDYQLKALPGVFVTGEMLDWEAPTGGYLITGSMATGRAAAAGMLRFTSSLPTP